MFNIPDHLIPELEKELRSGFQQNRITAEAHKKSNHKFNLERHKSVEGLGQKIATIPADAFHFWGQKLGYKCWEDKGFMDEFLRDNPECRVNSGGTKEITVGFGS
jgi:hypothetical protein